MGANRWVGLVSLAFALCACGSPGAAGGEAARPDDPTAASAMGREGEPGSESCTEVSPQAAPFLADWQTDQRAALEAAMQDGVAILKYTCGGIQVLQDCKLKTKSEYGWAEVALKKDSLEIDQSSDLSATLPIAAASISGEIRRGLRLRLAYAMIGRKPRKEDDGELSKDLLVGKPSGACEGATHYVRWAWVGAFDFGTATEGSVAGGAKVLGAGAEGSSASAKKIGRTDGELSACKPGTAEEKPPPGCNAIVQLQLGPVVDKPTSERKPAGPPGSDPGAVAENAINPCSAGFVLDAKGQCRTKSSASAYLCDPRNRQECVEQCEKGSGQSCHNAALAQFAKDVHPTYQAANEVARTYYEKGCDKDYYPSCGSFATAISMGKTADRARARQLHEKACNGGYANSCMSLAQGMEHPIFSDEPSKFTPNKTAAFNYTKKACTLGSGYACSQLAKRYIEGNGVLANTEAGLSTLASSCDRKNLSACLELARYLVTGDGGAKKNEQKGFAIYKSKCEQNISTACVGAANVLRTGSGPIAKDPAQAKKFLDHACNNMRSGKACAELAEMHEKGELGKADAAAARSLYEQACPKNGRGPRDGCYGAGVLHEKGAGGAKRDLALAATYYGLGCSSFDPDKTGIPEKSCSKALTLLDKQKRNEELRRVAGTLCGFYRNKKACAVQKKIAPPPPPPPPGKGPPPPPPGKAPPPPPPPAKAPPPPPPPPTAKK